jgi:hypothetical protein
VVSALVATSASPSRARAASAGQFLRPRSPPVKHILAQVLHLEDRSVGAAGRRRRQVRLDHLGDNDVVVALGNDLLHLALVDPVGDNTNDFR